MINKRKVYVRRWRCSLCKSMVRARYSKESKTWVLKCMCGEDNSFKKLNSGSFALLSKNIYPVD